MNRSTQLGFVLLKKTLVYAKLAATNKQKILSTEFHQFLEAYPSEKVETFEYPDRIL